MEKFIHDENLKLLRKRLTEVASDADRKIIVDLIKEEEARLLPPRRTPRAG